MSNLRYRVVVERWNADEQRMLVVREKVYKTYRGAERVKRFYTVHSIWADEYRASITPFYVTQA